MIDLLICIRIPLEIALARRIKRDILHFKDKSSKKEIVEGIEYFVTLYQNGLRDVYFMQNNIKGDYILNGLDIKDDEIEEIIKKIGERLIEEEV